MEIKAGRNFTIYLVKERKRFHELRNREEEQETSWMDKELKYSVP